MQDFMLEGKGMGGTHFIDEGSKVLIWSRAAPSGEPSSLYAP